MAQYKGSGWHFQTARHSRARKYGRAGGKYLHDVYLEHKGKNKDGSHNYYRTLVGRTEKIDFLMKSGLHRREQLESMDDRTLNDFFEAGLQAKGITSKKNYGRSEKSNPKFTRIDMMFKFEDMNPEYLEYQMEGLMGEIQKPRESQDLGYIREKIRNIKSQFNTTFDNFSKRIEHEDLQKEFIKKLKENKKNLSFEIPREHPSSVTIVRVK